MQIIKSGELEIFKNKYDNACENEDAMANDLLDQADKIIALQYSEIKVLKNENKIFKDKIDRLVSSNCSHLTEIDELKSTIGKWQSRYQGLLHGIALIQKGLEEIRNDNKKE